MYINTTGYYIPQERVYNSHFFELNGLDSGWIEQRTGIKSRSKARPYENINTMSLEAVRNAIPELPYDIKEVNLIISASYSPYDTVVTAAHTVQNEFEIEDAQVLYLSSACPSFLNALEVVEGYFAMGKADKALVLGADKNSDYYNEKDPAAGHLWGDAAAAFFISKERISASDAKIIDIHTRGLGHLSKAMEAVSLKPKCGGISMPFGKDVFIKACKYMPQSVEHILDRHGLAFDDITYFIAHQANMRIINNIAMQLSIPEEKLLYNITELGNTGSVSSALVYAQNVKKFKEGDLVAMTVFGGGYSTGACLISIG